MNDVLHALMFIAIFGVIFMSLICAEAWYLKRKGMKGYYCRESVANICTGAMYKVVDGIGVVLFLHTSLCCTGFLLLSLPRNDA